jgi:hypothetical protein
MHNYFHINHVQKLYITRICIWRVIFGHFTTDHTCIFIHTSFHLFRSITHFYPGTSNGTFTHPTIYSLHPYLSITRLAYHGSLNRSRPRILFLHAWLPQIFIPFPTPIPSHPTGNETGLMLVTASLGPISDGIVEYQRNEFVKGLRNKRAGRKCVM